MFTCYIGRLQEKSLLGEACAELNSLDCLRPISRATGDDSLLFNASGKVSPDITKKLNSPKLNPRSKSPEDLRHSAIQASDEDINNFTEVTLGHSWVLPPTIKSKNESPKKTNAGQGPQSQSQSTITTSTINSKGQIIEQNFDDFEPFIMVPRSPESKVRYHPNLKDYPMPSSGPPQLKKIDPLRAMSSINKNLKNPQTKSKPLTSSSSSSIEFQGLSLKKTTLSRTEANDYHKTNSSGSRPTTAESETGNGTKNNSSNNNNSSTTENVKVLKRQKMKSSKKETSSPFFFPALLSAAPHINLAPVGYDIIQQENSLLYENTDNF